MPPWPTWTRSSKSRAGGGGSVPCEPGSRRASYAIHSDGGIQLSYDGGVPVLERPDDEPGLRSFTVDDPRLWEPRPQLSPDEFALEGVTDEEWGAFYAALVEA